MPGGEREHRWASAPGDAPWRRRFASWRIGHGRSDERPRPVSKIRPFMVYNRGFLAQVRQLAAGTWPAGEEELASWREEIDQLVGARQLAGEMGRRFAKWWARIRQLATARWSFLLHFCTVADLGDRLLFSIRSWGRGPRSPRGVHFPGGGRPDGLASWRKIDQLAED